MNNHKRMFITCTEEDRMSNLPEHLVNSILERLPVQDAVRTSILSRNWRYKWTTMMALVLDKQFSNKFAENGAFSHNGFIRIINHIIFHHNGPILKFSLHIPQIELDSFQEVDQWMLVLSRNKVMRELIFTNSNRRYELPYHVFSFSQLRKLTFENCTFRPPLWFEGFPNLEDLFLTNVDFKTNSCGTVVNLPRLRLLSLDKCKNVFNFNIKAKRLRALLVNACFDVMLLQLMKSPCLIVVYVYFWKPAEEFVRVERMNLTKMLSVLPNILHLFIDGHFLKFLCADYVPKWLPRAINSLKQLRLLNCRPSDLDQLHGALCLLQNSPNLEKLCIMDQQIKTQAMHNYDVEPTSEHLESLACLDHTLNKLQIIETINLQGSRLQLLLIKLLLAYSPFLDKLIIFSSETSDGSERRNIAEDVMWFPRASPKAETLCLITEHY